MDLFVTINVATFKNILNNEVNNYNCRPDHNRSELLCHWVVKDK
jgi:hypothetical protein